MRFRQFKITEAPEDDAEFKAKVQAFYATLTKKNPKDGFFANNTRKNENMRLVAQFAQDNNLQSMLNPLTGKSYKFSEPHGDEGGDMIEPEEVSMDLPTLDRMADVGELTPGVLAKLGNEMLAAKSGKAGLGGRTVSSLFGIKDPETADKIQAIMAKNKAASEKPSTAKPAAAGTDAGHPDQDSGPETLSRLADIPAVSDALGARGDLSPHDDEFGAFADPGAGGEEANTAPAPAAAKPAAAKYSMGTPSGKVKIKPGDSLGAIARKYGTTVDAMMKANPNIKDANRIAAGGALKLPKGANTKRFDATVAMQKELIAQGADIKADGIMGPKTHAAIDDPEIGGKVTAARQAARDAAAAATPADQGQDATQGAQTDTAKVVPGTVGTLDSQAADKAVSTAGQEPPIATGTDTVAPAPKVAPKVKSSDWTKKDDRGRIKPNWGGDWRDQINKVIPWVDSRAEQDAQDAAAITAREKARAAQGTKTRTSFTPTKPVQAPASKVVPATPRNVPNPGEVAPAVAKKTSSSASSVRKPGQTRTRTSLHKQESYDGMPRLKYLAGIKE